MAKPETRWTLLDKAVREIDPSWKIAVNKLARAKAEARLASLSDAEFRAEVHETLDFARRMAAKTAEIRAAFYACMAARESEEVRHAA